MGVRARDAQVVVNGGSAPTPIIWAYGSSATFMQHTARATASVSFSSSAVTPCVAATSCSGRGACVAATNACACGDGYSGTACAACADGFTAGTGGACVTASTTSAAVTATGMFDSSVVGTDGSAARTGFKSAFETQMGAALSAPGRIVVNGVTVNRRRELASEWSADVTARRATAVSVSVTFSILPGAGPAVSAIVATLRNLTASGGLSLCPSGGGACALGAGAVLGRQAIMVSYVVAPPAGVRGSVTLQPGYTLAWVISGSSVTFTATLNVAGAWLAVGFNAAGRMVGTDAVVGTVATPAAAPTRVGITSQAPAGLDVARVTPLTGGSVSSTGGTTVLTFTRPLAAAAPGEVTISGSGGTVVVFAHGDAGVGGQSYHGMGNRGSVVVDFATGGVSGTAAPVLFIVHAALMIASWGVLLPAGVFSARCCRHRPDACWFKFHRAFQVWRPPPHAWVFELALCVHVCARGRAR